MGRSIFITSFKGGTGKTTVCANLSCALCNLGHSVVIVDADYGMRCMDMVLGLEDNVVFNSADVMSGVCETGRAMITHPGVPLLSFLPAPADNTFMPDLPAVRELISDLCGQFDYEIGRAHV